MQLNSLFSFLGRNPLSADGDAQVNADAAQASTGFGAMLASTLAMLAHRQGTSGADAAERGGTDSPESAGDVEFVMVAPAAAEADRPAADVLSGAGGGSESSGKDTSDEAAPVTENGDGAASARGVGEGSPAAEVSRNGRSSGLLDDADGAGGASAKDVPRTADANGNDGNERADRQSSDSASKTSLSNPDADASPAIEGASHNAGTAIGASSASSESANGRRSGATGGTGDVRRGGSEDSRTVTPGAAADLGKVRSGAAGDLRDVRSGAADNPINVPSGAAEGGSNVRSGAAESPNNVLSRAGESSAKGQSGAAQSSTEGRSGAAQSSTEAQSGAADNSTEVRSGAAVSSSDGRSGVARDRLHAHIGSADASAEARADFSANAARISADSTSLKPGAVAGQTSNGTLDGGADAAATRRSPDDSPSKKPAELRGTDPNTAKLANDRGLGDVTEGSASSTRPASNGEAVQSASRGEEAAHTDGHSAKAAESAGVRSHAGAAAASSATGDRRRASDLERSVRRLVAERAGFWTESSAKATNGETEPSSAQAEGSEPQTTAAATASLVDTDSQPKSATTAAQTPTGVDAEAALSASKHDASRDDSAAGENDIHESDTRLAAEKRSAAANTGGEDSHDFTSDFDGAAEDAFDLAADELAPDIVEFEDILDARDATVEPEAAVEALRTESAPEPVLTSERTWHANASASAAAAERAARPRHGGAAQWMHTLLENGLDGFSFDEEWKVLEMKLDEGQGTMTVRARRDEEKVSITVNFSDPQLRALAADQADRLQETLRAQYQTDVDFSLMHDNAGQSHADGRRSQGGGGSDANGGATGRHEPLSGADRARATRAALAGARNEWIG